MQIEDAYFQQLTKKSWLYNKLSLAILGCGLAFINGWSAYVVGHGLQVSENFSYMSNWAIYIFAGVIQMAVLAGCLYLPDMWRMGSWVKRLLWLIPLWCIVISATLFECSHQVLAQIYSGQGPALMNVYSRELEALRNRLNAWTTQIPAIYKAKSNEYLAQALLSKQGLDESGQDGEGPIYRSRLTKYSDARSKFVDLSLPMTSLTSTSDFRADFAEIQARSKVMESQLSRVGELFKVLDDTAIPANVSAELTSIKSEVESKSAKFAAFNDVSPRSIAINETLGLLGKVRRGETFPLHYWLGVVYGFAPFAIGLIFSSCVRHHNEWNQRGSASSEKELEDLVERELAVEKLYTQLADVRQRTFHSKVRSRIFDVYDAQMKKRAANDDTSIDRRSTVN
ncbi:MAG: hypothetical protein V4454_01225 [Pseudomonadota bacterium]